MAPFDPLNPLFWITEQAPMAFSVFGADLRVRFANPFSRRMFPHPACVDPIGLHLRELGFDPPVVEPTVALYEEVIRTGEPRSAISDFNTPTGAICLHFHLTPAKGTDGKVEAVLGVGYDITRLNRVERELHVQREKYARAVREGSVYPWDYDPVSGRTNLDPAYLERIGLTAETTPPTPAAWYEWMHPDDREVARAAVVPWEKGEIDHYRYEFRTTDARGETAWFECRGGFEYRDGQSVPLQVGVNIDITERKRVERALAESEQLFAQFMDHSPAMAWIKDSQRRIVYGNRRTLEFISRTSAEILGKTTAEVLGDEYARRSLEQDRQVLENGVAITTKEMLQRPNGGSSPWLIVRFPLQRGDERQLGAVALDASELHRLQEEQSRVERQLLQAQKLESLGVLAGGIAHDFNNLLTAMLGFASLARMESGHSTNTLDYLDHIEKSAQRAAELCKQMLSYAGRGQVKAKSIDLNDLVAEMAQLLSTAISKRAVLKFNLGERLPPLHADSTQIRQIAMNLITNASDAIGEKSGVITLTTGLIDADIQYLNDLGAAHLPAKKYLYLEVSDTGSGISDEVRAKMFEPFFTTKFTGRGLGLSAVQGIVAAHGGALKVYTQPGKGSTFKVLFPAHDGEVDPTVMFGAKPRVPFGRDRWILIVDDEEDIRILARKALVGAGFRVETASDGRAGLQAYEKRPGDYALVLLDLTMPRMNGSEVFRAIRAIRPEAKVILASGFSLEDATTGFEGKGLAAFVRKPYRVEELLTAVEEAVGV